MCVSHDTYIRTYVYHMTFTCMSHDTHMYIQDWYVNVVEQFGMKLDGIAGGKEDHYLLVPVLLEESEEEKKPLLGGAYYISLGEGGGGRGISHDIERLSRGENV